jgi:CubicO group peptidase (beta-lactamase class C family)
LEKYSATQAQLRALEEDGVVPGISYCLFEHDWQVEYVSGMAQLTPTPEVLRPGMLYDLASLTKVLATTPVIGIYLQEGRLSLDDPVTKYLPAFDDERVRIYHLLTHSSSIGGYIKNRDQLGASQLKEALLTQLSGNKNLSRLIRYADVNFIYLGWIAEQIGGKPIHQLAKELVFDPLGMMETTDHPDPAWAVPTVISPNGVLLRGRVHDPKGAVLGEHCGSAGIFAPLKDVVNFSRALIETNLGGLLTDQTVAQIFSDQTRMPHPHLRGLGWKLIPTPVGKNFLASHTGYTGTWLVLDKQNDRGMVVLTNRVHPTGQNDVFLDRRDQIIATYVREMEKF